MLQRHYGIAVRLPIRRKQIQRQWTSVSPNEYYIPGKIIGRWLKASEKRSCFYETFTTSYSYVPIGRAEDKNGLKKALGNGDIQVTIAAH